MGNRLNLSEPEDQIVGDPSHSHILHPINRILIEREDRIHEVPTVRYPIVHEIIHSHHMFQKCPPKMVTMMITRLHAALIGVNDHEHLTSHSTLTEKSLQTAREIIRLRMEIWNRNPRTHAQQKAKSETSHPRNRLCSRDIWGPIRCHTPRKLGSTNH